MSFSCLCFFLLLKLRRTIWKWRRAKSIIIFSLTVRWGTKKNGFTASLTLQPLLLYLTRNPFSCHKMRYLVPKNSAKWAKDIWVTIKMWMNELWREIKLVPERYMVSTASRHAPHTPLDGPQPRCPGPCLLLLPPPPNLSLDRAALGTRETLLSEHSFWFFTKSASKELGWSNSLRSFNGWYDNVASITTGRFVELVSELAVLFWLVLCIKKLVSGDHTVSKIFLIFRLFLKLKKLWIKPFSSWLSRI